MIGYDALLLFPDCMDLEKDVFSTLNIIDKINVYHSQYMSYALKLLFRKVKLILMMQLWFVCVACCF